MTQKNAPPVISKELENTHIASSKALEIACKSPDGHIKFRIVEPIETLKQRENPYAGHVSEANELCVEFIKAPKTDVEASKNNNLFNSLKMDFSQGKALFCDSTASGMMERVKKFSADHYNVFCQKNEIAHKLCEEFITALKEANKAYDVYFCPSDSNHAVCNLGVVVDQAHEPTGEL